MKNTCYNIKKIKGDKMDFLNEKKQKQELTQRQKIARKIAELKKLEKIEKDIAKFKAKIENLKEQKKELEAKYDLA